MKHFIGTRFNLKTSNWKTNKCGNNVLTEAWLKDRFNLFETYCFPSVKNQSNQNFTWFVFFDVDTPKVYKDRVDLLSKDLPNFKPIFIDSLDKLTSAFKQHILKHVDASDKFIITTRIDNDDIIHRDFISTIQSLYIPEHLTVIDIRKGYQVSIDVPTPEVRNYIHPFNAFLSVVESLESFKTIYSREHYGWRVESNVVSYKKEYLWVELSHNENYVNHRQVKLKKAYKFNGNDFALSAENDFKLSFNDTLLTNLKIDKNRFFYFLQEKVKFVRKLPKRAIQFTKKKLRKLFTHYGLFGFKTVWKPLSEKQINYLTNNVKIASCAETLDQIKNTITNQNKGAYMRFGDGDIYLMVGKEDVLHKPQKKMSQEMKETFKLKTGVLHVGLPIHSDLFGFEEGMGVGIHKVEDKDALKYLSVSYKYIDLGKLITSFALHYLAVEDPKKCIDFLIFLKKTRPIFVGNKNIDKALLQDLFGGDVIGTPERDSYNEIDRIEKELCDLLDENKNDFKVVVVAMGCPGRILQKRILKKGYNVYLFDFGSLLDAFSGTSTRAWIRLSGGTEYFQDILNEVKNA